MRIKADKAGVSPALQELKKEQPEIVKTKAAPAESLPAEQEDAVAVDTETAPVETAETYNAKGVKAEGKVPRGLLVALRNHLAREGAELPPGLAKKVQRLGAVDGDADGRLTVAEIEGFAVARGIKLPALKSAPVAAPVEQPEVPEVTDPAPEVPAAGDTTVTPEVPTTGDVTVTPEVPTSGDSTVTPELPTTGDVTVTPEIPATGAEPVTLPVFDVPSEPVQVIADPVLDSPVETVPAEPSLIPETIVQGDTSIDQTLLDQLIPEEQPAV